MRSDNVTKGVQQAPHRSLMNALGMTEEEKNRPLIGIVNSYNEIVPGHMNLDKITEAVKLGVAMAGGTPVVFPAIAVCDGIAMGHVGMKYSLVTRDLICDSTECMAMAHQFDGLVCIPNCDKNVPGLLMAAARLNIPTIFVSGGPMLAGHLHGRKRSLSSMFEAVGSVAAGTMSLEELQEYEEKVCPTCGSCSGMYTANSMNCLTEALGMGLKGNGTIPAVYSARIQLAKHAGMQIMELVRKDIKPRDIMTKDAFLNALTVDMALGCSTNSMLHLPAIAHEAGVELNMEIANEISSHTPNLCHLAPAGPTYIEDLNEAGGVYAVMNELNKKGLLKTDLMTVTGKTVGENIEACVNRNPEVIRPIENPYSETGGIAVLKGNLAPDTGVVKRSAVVPEMMVHEGPARVFDCEGGRNCCDQGRQDCSRRCRCDPLRGTQRRPRHERNAESDFCNRRYGSWFQCCADYGRSFLRRIQRCVDWSCFPGSCCRRSHRTGRRGRYHQHQYSGKSSGYEGL